MKKEIQKKEVNSNNKRTGRYSEQELVYIKVNYKKKTDKEIAEKLGRPETGIIEQRKKMGLTKSVGRPKNQPLKITTEEYYASPENTEIMRDLTPAQRKEFAMQLFQNSNDYKRLQKQFTEDEMIAYGEIFTDYLAEFQQLLPQEVQQVHTLVTEQLIKERFLQRIKMSDTMKIKIQELQEQKISLIMKPEKTSEDNQKIEDISNIIEEIKQNREVTEHIWKELNDSAMRAERAMKALKFTREQRLKNQKEHGKTLATVAQKLNDAAMRESEGQHVAQINKEMEEFKRQAKNKGLMLGDF